MTLEYVPAPDSGSRPCLIECPLCGEDLSGSKSTSDHIYTKHLPEDFGLALLGEIEESNDLSPEPDPGIAADGGAA